MNLFSCAHSITNTKMDRNGKNYKSDYLSREATYQYLLKLPSINFHFHSWNATGLTGLPGAWLHCHNTGFRIMSWLRFPCMAELQKEGNFGVLLSFVKHD